MRKDITKKAALISAIALMASSVTACGSGSGEETTTTTTAETTTATMNEEQAAVVEQIEVEAEKLENPTLKFFSFWDINPLPGEPVPVALQLFQTKYGG